MSESIADQMEPVPGEPPRKPKGDLGVRTLSAIVMVAIAGTALWAGGIFFVMFVGVVCLIVVFEFSSLVVKLADRRVVQLIWLLMGLLYIGVAGFTLVHIRNTIDGVWWALVLISAIVATDVGAYFVGRTIGGPKIAPKISPSKTWSGLIGGAVFAGLAYHFATYITFIANDIPASDFGLMHMMPGAIIAIVAQAGDFFESWMKRKAKVKDSSSLIPGHGGMFDRADGFLAVLFFVGLQTYFFPVATL